jgi:hypothetical protein
VPADRQRHMAPVSCCGRERSIRWRQPRGDRRRTRRKCGRCRRR